MRTSLWRREGSVGGRGRVVGEDWERGGRQVACMRRRWRGRRREEGWGSCREDASSISGCSEDAPDALGRDDEGSKCGFLGLHRLGLYALVA